MVLEKTATMDPYELGRRLSVAVRADDARLVVDRIEKQTRKTASEERKITLALINSTITDGNMAVDGAVRGTGPAVAAVAYHVGTDSQRFLGRDVGKRKSGRMAHGLLGWFLRGLHGGYHCNGNCAGVDSVTQGWPKVPLYRWVQLGELG